MRGEIAITQEMINQNKMGWSQFDFFKHQLKNFVGNTPAGWYAYIERDKIHYFLWADYSFKPTEKYLQALKKDGYTVSISSNSLP